MLARLFAIVLSVSLAAVDAYCAETISPVDLAKVRAAEAARVGVIDRVYGSVVAVYGPNRQGGGSGVVYDEAGYALTNYHVVAGAGKEGFGGLADTKSYKWKLIGMDPGGDVAIIKLTGRDKFPVSPLGHSDRVYVGDFVMAMGNPFLLAEDQRPTVTLGVVSGVKRYQHGQTPTMLVYGNCIQVDSSINPGNSGGPLYNAAGEVIGINGRGSFKERGRVNVGVGYAISMEQIKNFIPDLLATKVCLHGTLDAVFGNREGGVICEQLNLDSKIAQLGLQLGDRLVAFDGLPIENANQYTNLVSTIPAGWPVEVTFEHEGARKSVWLRLPDLPYGAAMQKKQPKRKPMPRPKRKEGEPELPPPFKEPEVDLPQSEPGKISDVEINKAEYRRIVALWKQHASLAAKATLAIEWKCDARRKDDKVGTCELVVATDGRWRVAYDFDKQVHIAGFDGKSHFATGADGKEGTVDADRAVEKPLSAHAAALAALMSSDGTKPFKSYELQGSDRAQRRRAFRLHGTALEDRDVYICLSQYDDQDRPHVRLLKTGGGRRGGEDALAVTFHDEREIEGVKVPQRFVLVEGLAEVPQVEFVTIKCHVQRDVKDEWFTPARPVAGDGR